MVGSFRLVNTNSVAEFNLLRLSNSPFRFWVGFLTEYSNVGYALTADAVLNHDALRECYSSAYESTENAVLSFTFRQGNRSILVTELDLNRILQFPENNFVTIPTAPELFNFFNAISYHVDEGVFTIEHLGDMYKHRLPKEWNFFFHTINHVFAPKKGGFHGLPSFIQKIGYAVANNLRINYGKLLMEQILIVMGSLEHRDTHTYNVECFFPRFLQLVLNGVLSEEEKQRHANSLTSPALKLKNHVISSLENRGEYLNNNAAVLTDFFRRCLDDMNSADPRGVPRAEPIPEEAAQGEDVAQEEAQTEETEVEAETEGDVSEEQQYTVSYHAGSSSMALRFGSELENQQVQTTVIEPNTEMQTSQTLLPLKRKPDEREGVSAFSALSRDNSEGNLAVRPLAKARRMETEATACPSVDTEAELMAATILSSLSRSGTMGVDSDIDQVPSQLSEGNLGSLPIIRPLSSLSKGTSMDEGTSVDAERDVPTVTLSQFESLSQRVAILEATITNMQRTLDNPTKGEKEDESSYISPRRAQKRGKEHVYHLKLAWKENMSMVFVFMNGGRITDVTNNRNLTLLQELHIHSCIS